MQQLSKKPHHHLMETGREKTQGIIVWDPFVRFFHWSLLTLVMISAFTGFLGEEWWLDLHIQAGYGIGVLIVLRLIWGFVGPRYARFTSFIFSPRETLQFAKDLLRGRPGHYTGHNPAGALMVFALGLTLSAIIVSGLIVLGGQEKQGILADAIPYFIGRQSGEVHEVLAWLLLFLIVAHISGVLVESRLGGENLVLSMLTGRKRVVFCEKDRQGNSRTGHSTGKSRPASTAKPAKMILLLFFLIAGAGGGFLWFLTTASSGAFVVASRVVPLNDSYASECGDCHFAYPPILLPARSWQLLMQGLADHFGEDASLDEDSHRQIAAYLQRHAAEHVDTEAANNLRLVAPDSPLRISKAPYWVRRHKNISAAIFRRRVVGSKGNCIACHKDARSARFDDQKIHIPENKLPQK